MKLTIKLFIIVIILMKILTRVTSKKNPLLIGDESLPGLLFPQENERREVKSLDGVWAFGVFSNRNITKDNEALKRWVKDDYWNVSRSNLYKSELEDQYTEIIKNFSLLFEDGEVMQMPVPSSYNDIGTSAKLRDHVGAVWYARNFYVPNDWEFQKVFLRFGSVNYYAKVWINGDIIMEHNMGHLPFETEISHHLICCMANRIMVLVDNTLSQTSVPQGNLIESKVDNGTTWIQSHSFDFFNYAGIHRPVLLHTKPKVYINDITVVTEISDNTGIVNYIILTQGNNNREFLRCSVNIRDADDNLVTKDVRSACAGTIKIPNVKLWWPRGMSSSPAYLYTLEVFISTNPSEISDIYRLPIGIRTLKWNSTSLLLNDKPLYLRGFGRHEDSVLRGRGLDLVIMTRDYELLKWVGANAYRTSHYPYSDEVMDMADRQGFLIINECPSVDTETFSSELSTLHQSSLAQLIRRDKNRPSVIMWSIANEPKVWQSRPIKYFKQVTQYTKKLDPTRPVTAALSRGSLKNTVGQFLDVICFNKYNAWYHNVGRLDMIIKNVIEEAEAWHAKFKKPVIMSEYGADTIPGLHELPEFLWSEEYQTSAFSQHFKAFDQLRKHSWFVGELIWNFADFRTPPGVNRAGGNKKGIFTRNREPKMVAHLVRKRYHTLALTIDGQKPPDDLEYYTSNFATCSKINHL